ncbi:MAG: TetR/AcrR family transcriptional regulator [Sphingomonadales bacterium]|nr:TetR/AcrR family transcriptional regulator [Sphingomonadales bacterium]MDE2568917.1 TetR/AcrR family transcriptional regulator [Sphingomonadales bacterium]
MVTVSTLKLDKRTYHHGDLRAALIDAGLAGLESTGPERISLRELARTVGVSPTAVYRHFPDKQALLAALGCEALRMLGEAQREASERAGGGIEGFGATGRAYVRFALSHPGLFRLAIAHGPAAVDLASEDDEASRLLVAYAAELTDGSPEAVRRLSLQAWSVAHGLAMLMLDGRLPPDDAIIDEVISERTLFPRPPGASP